MDKKSLAIKVIRRSDGVLHPVLLINGVPPILPNLWAEELAVSHKFNSIKSYLDDLIVLYQWAAEHHFSVYKRLNKFNWVHKNRNEKPCFPYNKKKKR